MCKSCDAGDAGLKPVGREVRGNIYGPELILWDWNGTLLDDVDLCVDALNRLLAEFGYPQRYDHDQYRAIFGFPIEEYYIRAGFDFSKAQLCRAGSAVYGGLRPRQ